ncbi:MAG TPA: DMT family transporter [Reyranella sp.]|jgi:drug/metabolite transporter (DMT)-like permease|nr:DMT family transporter [Reyranella sp.]
MGRLLLPVVWIAWGLSYPLMSWSLEAIDLFSGRLVIMPISGLILLAFGVWSGAPALPDRGQWGQLALTGLFNMGLFQIFLISGIATLGPSRTPIIIYTMPTWSSLFAAFLLKERITPRIALSLVLSLAAVGIVVSQETAARAAPVGTLLTLLAAISFGIGTVLTKRDSLKGDPAINAAWQLILGAVPVVPVWLFFAHGAYFRPEHVRGIVALVWLMLVSNVLAYYCWFRVLRVLSTSVASLTTLVVPCVGFGSSALLVGGKVTWLDGAALGLIVAAVSLALFNRPAKT